MKKLSIITINYNNKEGLVRTCKSVVEQSNKDYEWIVIDGGSTDGSLEVINLYKQFIHYAVSEPDSGIYNAMNKGIDKATGEYCLFLNSGDWLYNSEVISDICKEVKDTSAAFIFGRINMVNRLGRNALSAPVPDKISGYYLFKESLPHQSTLTLTALLKQHHYNENYKIISDWLLTVEMILLRNVSTGNIRTVISNYMLDGISSNNSQLVAEERKRGFSELVGTTMFNDYQRLCCGETFLEILVHKVEKISWINNFMLFWNLPIAVLYKLRSFVYRSVQKRGFKAIS